MINKNELIKFENARIIFRNFSGAESRYNAEGKRNFCVVIDDVDRAQKMSNDGWNVRIWAPRDEDEEPIHFIKMNVNYNGRRPPRIVMVTANKHTKTIMDDDIIHELDAMDIVSADIIARPHEYDTGKFSLYVQTMYVVVEEDEFAYKYDDAPEETPF